MALADSCQENRQAVRQGPPRVIRRQSSLQFDLCLALLRCYVVSTTSGRRRAELACNFAMSVRGKSEASDSSDHACILPYAHVAPNYILMTV